MRGFGGLRHNRPSTQAWRVFEDKIASKVNWTKREIIVENIVCIMFGEGEETRVHLFCTC